MIRSFRFECSNKQYRELCKKKVSHTHTQTHITLEASKRQQELNHQLHTWTPFFREWYQKDSVIQLYFRTGKCEQTNKQTTGELESEIHLFFILSVVTCDFLNIWFLTQKKSIKFVWVEVLQWIKLLKRHLLK